MVRLPLHWAHAGILEEKPLYHFHRLITVLEAELEICIIVLGKIEKDGPRLKDRIGVAGVVYDGRNATIGIDFEERSRFLFVFREVN